MLLIHVEHYQIDSNNNAPRQMTWSVVIKSEIAATSML